MEPAKLLAMMGDSIPLQVQLGALLMCGKVPVNGNFPRKGVSEVVLSDYATIPSIPGYNLGV